MASKLQDALKFNASRGFFTLYGKHLRQLVRAESPFANLSSGMRTTFYLVHLLHILIL
jgi:hypothetical protein